MMLIVFVVDIARYLHDPWQWLTSSGNAMGLTACVVISTQLILLRFNRGRLLIQTLQETARQARVWPIIHIAFAEEDQETYKGVVPLRLENIGSGPGISLSASIGLMLNRNVNNHAELEQMTSSERHLLPHFPDRPMSAGYNMLVEIERPAWYQDMLYVLDYKDICGNKYQTRFSLTTYPGTGPQTDCVYAGPWVEEAGHLS